MNIQLSPLLQDKILSFKSDFNNLMPFQNIEEIFQFLENGEIDFQKEYLIWNAYVQYLGTEQDKEALQMIFNTFIASEINNKIFWLNYIKSKAFVNSLEKSREVRVDS
jgi:uncharacterized membrane-anchored protein